MNTEIKTLRSSQYKQIEDSLREKIHQGHWPAGAMLPGRRSLAREYGVSVMTIERAMTQIVADGIVFTDDRRGTFVTRQNGSHHVSASVEPQLRVGRPQDSVHQSSSLAIRSRMTGTVGIIASLYLHSQEHLELNNFWIRLMLQSLERSFSEDGKRTVFFNCVKASGQPLVPIGDAIEAVSADGAESIALIAFGNNPRDVDRELERIGPIDFPIVVITSGELRYPVPHVFYDNFSAGYRAAQHIMRHGCQDVLFLTPFTSSWVAERLAGVRAAVELSNLPAETVRVYPDHCGPWVQEEDPQVLGVLTAKKLLTDGVVPSGIICVNDGVAIGVMDTLSAAGLRPGRDYAIIGFDDHPQARASGLTTMRPPMENMGKEAGRLLQSAMHGEERSLQVRLGWHLVPRASTQ